MTGVVCKNWGIQLVPSPLTLDKPILGGIQIHVVNGSVNTEVHPHRFRHPFEDVLVVPNSEVGLVALSECVNRLNPTKFALTGLHAVYDRVQIARAVPSLRTRAVRAHHHIILEVETGY